jgi:hypothetical protein
VNKSADQVQQNHPRSPKRQIRTPDSLRHEEEPEPARAKRRRRDTVIPPPRRLILALLRRLPDRLHRKSRIASAMGLRGTRHLRLSRQLVRPRAITRRGRSSLALPAADLRGRDEAAGGGVNQMCMSSSERNLCTLFPFFSLLFEGK